MGWEGLHLDEVFDLSQQRKSVIGAGLTGAAGCAEAELGTDC